MRVRTDAVASYEIRLPGDWSHSIWTVREVAAQHDFWVPPRCRLGRAELTGRILAAGAVAEEFAIEATMMLDGGIMLTDGCHRWAVADALGLEAMPVIMSQEMRHEDEPRTNWHPQTGLS